MTVILKAEDGTVYTAPVDVDVRSWRPDMDSRADNTAAWRDLSFDIPLEEFGEVPSGNYQIYLKDISQQDNLVSYLKTVVGVREVNYSQVTADALSGANNMISYVSIGIIGILLALVTERFNVLNSILRFLPIQTINKTLIPISLGIGAGIGLLGSIVTVRKHLKVSLLKNGIRLM